MNNYVLNEQGEPVAEPDVRKWGQWFERAERHVAEDHVNVAGEKVHVSTVFLGLDHNFYRGNVGQEGLPILWETMIFGGEHDQWQARYSSRADALAGHEHALKIARGELRP